MGKYIINIIVKVMERNQCTYKPCKMYMLTGNCLNKACCPFNHLAPKVTQEKKKLQLKISQPFSMDFHPTGSQKDVEKTEMIMTEKKPEPEPFIAQQAAPQVQNKPSQPRQNQNPVNSNNQIDLNQLDRKTQQEIMQNMQMQQQYQQMILMQQLQNQQKNQFGNNQFGNNQFGMNLQQNMMGQFGGMMGQFGGMNQGQAMNQFQNNLQNMEQMMKMMEAEADSDDEYDDE